MFNFGANLCLVAEVQHLPITILFYTFRSIKKCKNLAQFADTEYSQHFRINKLFKINIEFCERSLALGFFCCLKLPLQVMSQKSKVP